MERKLDLMNAAEVAHTLIYVDAAEKTAIQTLAADHIMIIMKQDAAEEQ